ncbi:MAG: hypothetical protein IKM46_00750, partial [Clostridia bacterium]|nr:hypothetical protein [Clostridia bacterium]
LCFEKHEIPICLPHGEGGPRKRWMRRSSASSIINIIWRGRIFLIRQPTAITFPTGKADTLNITSRKEPV